MADSARRPEEPCPATIDVVPRPTADVIDTLIDAVSAGGQPAPPAERRPGPRAAAGASPRGWRSRHPLDSQTMIRVVGSSLTAFVLGGAATFWALRMLEPPQPRQPAAPPIQSRETPRAIAPPTRPEMPAVTRETRSAPLPAPPAPTVPTRLAPAPSAASASAADTRLKTPPALAAARRPPPTPAPTPAAVPAADAYALPAVSASMPAVSASLPAPTMMIAHGATAEEAVRRTLSRYQAAYEQLDASAAELVWPSVDRSALENAFGALRSQNLAFESCDLQVQTATATARCWGTAEYVPRVGSSIPRRGRYEWRFSMRRADAGWQIEQVTAKRVGPPS